MFYIPSFAWWLVLATMVVLAIAFWVLLLVPGERGVRNGLKRITFPFLTVFLALGLYFLEHAYQLSLNGTSFGQESHPLSLTHFLQELIPLAFVLVLLGLVVRSWLGWARLFVLIAVADSFLLLLWPGPLVNHLFQLVTLVAVVWGIWGLIIARPIRRAAGWVGPALLVVGGGIGAYCELGMMFI